MMHTLENHPLVDLSEGLSIPSDLVRLQEAIGGDEVLLNLLLKSRRISFLTFYRPKIGSERNKPLVSDQKRWIG